MKKLQPNEDDLRKWLFVNYDGWTQRIEPSLGMKSGIADCLFMTDVGLVFVELKIASLSDNLIWSRQIRPAQISWHYDFYKSNKDKQPLTLFLFGVWCESKKNWRIFLREGNSILNWEDGFPISETKEIDCNDLTNQFENYCAERI